MFEVEKWTQNKVVINDVWSSKDSLEQRSSANYYKSM